MQLTPTTAPVSPSTAPADPAEPAMPSRAPSTLAVPSLEDGSASASASLNQVASYVDMLQTAHTAHAGDYARLVKRGFLDSAIEYTRFALAVLEYDKRVDNDGFEGMVEGAVLQALLAARNMGTPTVVEPNLVAELGMARAAASNAADGLRALVTGH